MTLDELIRSLMTYELNLKRSEEERKVKTIDRKVEEKSKVKKMSSEEGSSESESDEDLTLITRKLQSILKRRKNHNFSSSSKSRHSFRQRSKHNTNSKPSSNKKSDSIICYECKEEGHMHGECPKLKKMLEKKKKDHWHKGKRTKAMVAT